MSKYAKKPWNETCHLLRRCMGNVKVDSSFSPHLGTCLQRLQNAQNVSSLSAVVSSLEAIAKRIGLGSHLSPTETACYLTADLFYLEVLLKPNGGLEDVKVALHGEAPVVCSTLNGLMYSRRFEDFSTKLNDLSSRYNVPGDNDAKIKVCTALQFMEKDLLTMSHTSRSCIGENEAHIYTILNGKVGQIMPSGPETPMKIQYLISPLEAVLQKHGADIDGLTQNAFVMLESSSATHQLQLAPLIPSPLQMDAQGLPVFNSLAEVASESLPAYFILKLQPPVAVCSSIIHRMEQISDVRPLADQQRETVLQLLRKTAGGEEGFHDSWNHAEEADFLVALPSNQVHRYVLLESAWNGGSWEGAVIDSIPFTHPSHVPLLLELLRLQSTLNILLTSCIKGRQHYTGTSCDLYCEVMPQSEMSFSITFFRPGTSSLSVLLVTVIDSLQIRCQLFAPNLVDDATNDYISRVMTRCMSIPITMRAICKRLPSPMSTDTTNTTAGGLEISISPDEAMNTAVSAPMDCSSHPVAPDTIDLPTCSSEMKSVEGEHLCSPVSQNAPEVEEEEEELAEVDAAPDCYVVSVSSVQEVNDANTDAAAADADHYPLSSVCVFPHWLAQGHLAEPV
ncbi:hypothetical protein ACEWY4_018643 [Coilia grayii]|uniref:Mediator of RNA polymerase II transcription subunit 1 n=1 Tax=Coilia grayii TaxID=363190 RepID=A0ABD1JGV3_9TELE